MLDGYSYAWLWSLWTDKEFCALQEGHWSTLQELK